MAALLRSRARWAAMRAYALRLALRSFAESDASGSAVNWLSRQWYV